MKTPRPTLLLSFGLAFALLVASATAATLPSVPVTSCGQVVPAKTIGHLTTDLDCTGYAGDLAVEIGNGSTLDLAGFTLTGGYNGVGCIAACARGEGFCTSCCEIKNGTVQGAESTGILGDKLTLTDVIVRDSGLRGIDGNRQYEPLPGLKINGKQNLGKNIGDLGGLSVAHAAYRQYVADKRSHPYNSTRPRRLGTLMGLGLAGGGVPFFALAPSSAPAMSRYARWLGSIYVNLGRSRLYCRVLQKAVRSWGASSRAD